MAPAPCACTAFKLASRIVKLGAFRRPRALRSPPAAGAFLAERPLLRPSGRFPRDLHRRIRPTRPEPDSPRAEPEAARLNFPWAKYGKGLISRGKDG